MLEFSLIIADDHPLMRAGIKEVVSADRRFNLVGYAQTGGECLELIRRLQPDVALIDVNISRPDGPQILNALRTDRCKTLVCFLTEDENQVSSNLVEAAKDSTAVFLNERLPDQLRGRLRDIANNLTPREAAAGLPSAAALPVDANFRRLTPRQNQIVAMLKVGSTNRQIAHFLGLTEGTVKVHLHRIYRTIGVSNRTQLTAQCFAAR